MIDFSQVDSLFNFVSFFNTKMISKSELTTHQPLSEILTFYSVAPTGLNCCVMHYLQGLTSLPMLLFFLRFAIETSTRCFFTPTGLFVRQLLIPKSEIKNTYA